MKTVTAHLKSIVATYARAAVLGTAVITTAFLAPTAARAQVSFSVNIAPPVIPVYEQPPVPGDGYIWTPGYWAYGDQGYFWVDGAWVEAPYEGALWTPGYWGMNDGAYLWNAGYWGQTVGYYGGIDYGFGYFGSGFYGGRWNGGHFFYNSAYNRLGNRGFRNVYDDHSHGNGFFHHQGSRAFDPNPRRDDHREAGIRGNNLGFNGDNRRGYNNQGSRGNFDQNTNRGGFNQNQQNRGVITQDNRGNDTRSNGFQQGNRPANQGGDNQQRNPSQPAQNQQVQNANRPAYTGGNQNQGNGRFPPKLSSNHAQYEDG